MANIPSTILIKSLDEGLLSPKMLHVVVKELFRFGVTKIGFRGSQVVVNLTYSPKKETLLKKFGNLPIKYIRMNNTKEDEIALFETAMRRFQFNLAEDEDEEKRCSSSSSAFVMPQQQQPKRAREEEEEESKIKNNKIKILENRMLKPAASSSSVDFDFTYDEDAADFCSQKFDCKKK